MKQSMIILLVVGWMALPALAGPVREEVVVEERIDSEEVSFRVVRVVRDLAHPWGIAFLPDGRWLVTERPGRLWLVDEEAVHAVNGVPAVRALGQGGLLDVIVHPDFEDDPWIYLSYAADYQGGIGTRVARARLHDTALHDLEVIFQMDPPTPRGGIHFGSRMVFDSDGYLFVTLGERGQRDLAQRLNTHHGKVVRLHADGRVPTDNPFVDRRRAHPEIFSYGHRNQQGMIYDATTGLLWTHEHGPRGGDALHIIRPGLNYGWPRATHGEEYRGGTIGTLPENLEDVVNPVVHWTPSIAPSGMAQLRDSGFPEWEGNLFVGALVQQHIRRVVLEGESVVHQEELVRNQFGRIRELVQGPDGALWFATDAPNGGVYRLEPLSP